MRKGVGDRGVLPWEGLNVEGFGCGRVLVCEGLDVGGALRPDTSLSRLINTSHTIAHQLCCYPVPPIRRGLYAPMIARCLARMATKPGYAALRRFRASIPGTDYFVTVKTLGRTTRLAQPGAIEAIRREEDRLAEAGGWKIRCRCAMPDHVHLVFSLGETVSLAECVRLFKGRLCSFLRPHRVQWQPGFYERRLRPDDDRLPVFLYVYLNPYRAELLHIDERWPGYRCENEDWSWFEPLTNSGVPFPEWLGPVGA